MRDWLAISLVAAQLWVSRSGQGGFAPCWNRTGGFTYNVCCSGTGHPSCFDAIFTYERCCYDADYDPVCWQWARKNVDETIRQASLLAVGYGEHIDALRWYRQDEGLLYLFCCSGTHNGYCWGRGELSTLLPDQDSWDGVLDVSEWYGRCCFPRLRLMLDGPSPPWMQQQISRDIRAAVASPELWPSRAQAEAFILSLPERIRRRFCEYHVSADGQIRHCNFTERGFTERRDFRMTVFARAMQLLAQRGELPRKEFTFIFSHADVEWQDYKWPVLTFQRAKSARRLIRVPMWEQLDGFWSRRVEQDVLSHESIWPFERKRGKKVFWRGTDSAVPAGDCHGFSECEVSERTLRHFHRLQLVQLSRNNPRRIDALLSGAKRLSIAEGHDKLYRRLGFLDRKEWTISAQLQFRYLLDVDGSSQSTRLYWVLLSNSAVFKQATRCCNWYSDSLRPFIHYVPVRRDLSDLALKVQWLQQRPRLARAMARRSSAFARRKLSHEDAMHYLARVIAAIAELQ